jgi:hypothetical protein
VPQQENRSPLPDVRRQCRGAFGDACARDACRDLSPGGAVDSNDMLVDDAGVRATPITTLLFLRVENRLAAVQDAPAEERSSGDARRVRAIR